MKYEYEKKFDATLRALKDGKEFYKSLADLTEAANLKGISEAKKLVDKLIEDGYAKTKGLPEKNNEDTFNVRNYSITTPGEMLLKNGGYEAQTIRDRSRKRWEWWDNRPKRLWPIVGLFAVASLILTVGPNYCNRGKRGQLPNQSPNPKQPSVEQQKRGDTNAVKNR